VTTGVFAKMDAQKLRDLLKGTLDPNVGKEAEEHLNKIRKIAGFGPSLMKLVMIPELDVAEKQAAVIYLKNLVFKSWETKEEDLPTLNATTDADEEFCIHEQDKEFMRNNIVEAVVHSPEVVRSQLGVTVLHIVKHDFPLKWPNLVKNCAVYLTNPDTSLWHGALICLHQLTKNFEYKKQAERKPLLESMAEVLPALHERMKLLMSPQSDDNMLLQKRILKIFYAVCQFHFPKEIISNEFLMQWMEVFRQILTRSAQPEGYVLPDSIEDRLELPGWKLYKWSLHILNRLFERYGCPSTCSPEHKNFATWYIKTFTQGIIEVLLTIMNKYASGEFVSPRVMHQIFNYIECGLGQSIVWKHIHPHMEDVLQKVMFPHFQHTQQDQETWETDPVEFIRSRADIYEDLVSPSTAATALLQTVVRKRKQMLDRVMTFVYNQLNSPAPSPQVKSGAFHVIGCLASVLTKKDIYKDKLEAILLQYVFPEFQSEFPFLRSKAYWVLQHVTEITWTNNNPSPPQPQHLNTKVPRNLFDAVQMCLNALLNDGEMPVEVDAAMCISYFIATQDEHMEELLVPMLPAVVRKLVSLIKQTESEDLTNVIAKLVQSYSTHLEPIAVDITTELALTFQQVVSTEEGADEKAITAMSILGTVETLLSAMEDDPATIAKLEPIVLQLVAHILNKNMLEFYEEALSLIYNMTSSHISADMWKCYELLHHVFSTDGFDYFMEMLPVLHNYVTVDTPAFLAVDTRLTALCQMCQKILTNGEDEDGECHAAKLLEVVILQCNPSDQVLNDISSLVLTRHMDKTRPIETAELRTMLLQVIIAGLYTNTGVMYNVFSANLPGSTDTVAQYVLHHLLEDIDCFLGLHDRKLAVLGICTLMQLGPERVPALEPATPKLLPALLTLFQGLKRAYLAKAAEDNASEASEEEELDSDFDENEVLDDNEDELNDNEFMSSVKDRIEADGSLGGFDVNATIEDDQDEDEDSDDDSDILSNPDETELESFSTPLDKEDSDVDEYWVFKTVMCALEGGAWFPHLTAPLSADQQKEMQEIATLADQRRAVMESKKIQQSGGYNFQQVAVPSTFNFAGSENAP